MANWVKYNADKLDITREQITQKNDSLLSEISVALANGDTNTYNYLKTLQLQCEAQLRFIKLLESNFEDDRYIIC